MSPAARKPRQPAASKAPRSRATVPAAAPTAAPTDPPAPAVAETVAIPSAAAPSKPPPAFPRHVPLETGLSDYSMWIEMFTDADIPPLPDGARRGRIWT